MTSGKRWTLHHGDCREVLAGLPDASVDAIVSDPPYEIAFMQRGWDASGIAYDVGLWTEALRVLKPGGHLLAFGATRTYHRLACAIEDAGFEIRDSLHWLYGSGFPKSLDVSKAIDKAAGAEREIVGTKQAGMGSGKTFGMLQADGSNGTAPTEVPVTAPATPEAERWAGWGTALKPAHEPVVVARKPLSGTVAETVIEYGTGALNIDACRVSSSEDTRRNAAGGDNGLAGSSTFRIRERRVEDQEERDGRWPANVIFDSDAAEVLDGQSGETRSTRAEMPLPKQPGFAGTVYGPGGNTGSSSVRGHNDSGGASRFFPSADFSEDDFTSFRYVAKPDRAERNAGLENLPERQEPSLERSASGAEELDDVSARFLSKPTANIHPTVKPLDLMRWLCRLVTPPGGTVLDPFAGSGTTVAAALLEGFDAVGIELTEEYLPIIEGRCRWAERESRFGPIVGPTQIRKEAQAVTLFDVDIA